MEGIPRRSELRIRTADVDQRLAAEEATVLFVFLPASIIRACLRRKKREEWKSAGTPFRHDGQAVTTEEWGRRCVHLRMHLTTRERGEGREGLTGKR